MKEKVVESKAWYIKVLDRLNLTDEGKIQAFGKHVIRDLEKKIRDHKRNIDILCSKLDDELVELNNELVELEEGFENSFTDINPEKTKTEALRKEYVEEFVQQCLDAECKLQNKKDEIKTVTDSYESQIKEREDKINSLEFYLSKLR